MYSPQPVDFSSVKQPIVLRQWIQEIFDFRFLICDFVPASLKPGRYNRQSKISNQKSKIASRDFRFPIFDLRFCFRLR